MTSKTLFIKIWIRTLLVRIPYISKMVLQYELSKKYSNERNEAKQILCSIRTGKIKRALIVNDYYISPPTYGDFFWVVMLARYFTTLGIPVSFVIVDGEYRSDWHDLDVSNISELVSGHIEMTKFFLDTNLAEIKVLKWKNFKTKYLCDVDTSICFPFSNSVEARSDSVYGHAFNTINYLCAESNQEFMDRFLLSYSEFEGKVLFTKPPQPYITWGCRYSNKGGEDRNATESDFLQIFKRLQILYPNHAIMVISDEEGCMYFKNIAHRNNFNCIFSKDFSKTLLGDAALILGSKYFYMLRGGGISVFPQFSKIPHERVTYLVHETVWTDGRPASWATEDQLFRPLILNDDFKLSYLPSLSMVSKVNEVLHQKL